MIFFFKKATFFILFILLAFGIILQANNLASNVLKLINTGIVVSIFYPTALTEFYIFWYKKINPTLLVSIFIIQYIFLRIKFKKSFFSIVSIFLLYSLIMFLVFMGLHWTNNSHGIIYFSYIGLFILLIFVFFLKIIKQLEKK